jgi:hypothetical protein
MIASGVNAKALSTYMGQSSITVTIDRYGHLMPGNEKVAAKLLDARELAEVQIWPRPRSCRQRSQAFQPGE